MIFLIDKYNNDNLIYYASVKSRKVVRSVLGAETFSMADSCDTANMKHHNLKHILGIDLKITILIDSAALFDVMIRNAPTTGKRLKIDNEAATKAYDEEIVDDNIWIRQKYNLADALTKTQINSELITKLDSNQLRRGVEN